MTTPVTTGASVVIDVLDDERQKSVPVGVLGVEMVQEFPPQCGWFVPRHEGDGRPAGGPGGDDPGTRLRHRLRDPGLARSVLTDPEGDEFSIATGH